MSPAVAWTTCAWWSCWALSPRNLLCRTSRCHMCRSTVQQQHKFASSLIVINLRMHPARPRPYRPRRRQAAWPLTALLTIVSADHSLSSRPAPMDATTECRHQCLKPLQGICRAQVCGRRRTARTHPRRAAHTGGNLWEARRCRSLAKRSHRCSLSGRLTCVSRGHRRLILHPITLGIHSCALFGHGGVHELEPNRVPLRPLLDMLRVL